MSDKKTKKTRDVEAMEKDSNDFGDIHFSATTQMSVEDLQDSIEVFVNLDGVSSVNLSDDLVGQFETKVRKDKDGVPHIVIKSGQRIILKVSNIPDSHYVELEPYFSFQTGLTSLGYNPGKLYILNNSEKQAVIKHGDKIARSFLR